MTNNGGTPMDTREAIIVSAATGNPIPDVDPINLTVVEGDQAMFTEADSVHGGSLSDAMRVLWMIKVELITPHLIWSDTRTPVTVECDTCLGSAVVHNATLLDGQEEDEGDGVMCIDCMA